MDGNHKILSRSRFFSRNMTSNFWVSNGNTVNTGNWSNSNESSVLKLIEHAKKRRQNRNSPSSTDTPLSQRQRTETHARRERNWLEPRLVLRFYTSEWIPPYSHAMRIYLRTTELATRIYVLPDSMFSLDPLRYRTYFFLILTKLFIQN